MKKSIFIVSVEPSTIYDKKKNFTNKSVPNKSSSIIKNYVLIDAVKALS